MEKHINIAIDGPSGAGKSTLAKRLAAQLNFIYIDTGALYRTVGYHVRKNNADPTSVEQVVPLLPSAAIDLIYDEQGRQRMILNGEDVSDFIRTQEISRYASDVSALPPVREFLLDTQRRLAAENNVIMDGRDIGTVILPNAQVKIFLTATPEVRSHRRYLELIEKGEKTDYETVLKEINQRDYNDSHRATAPLRPSEDSVIVDTSEMDLEQANKALLDVIAEKTGVQK
ncbi:MAG: (d)CMP kinase [Oscillospiraceae bacterium]|nr:(d)CMP kinase [Oscillospiraceae bacterium]